MSPTAKYAGTATDVGANPGVSAWTSPNNALGAPDTVLAAYPYFQGVTVNFTSNPLQLTNYGFAIPSTAVIDGIKVDVTHAEQQASTYAYLIKTGGVHAGNQKDTSAPFVTPATRTVGGANDLWGASWTPADINNSGFGIELNSTETHDPADSDYWVDACRITVYWHVANQIVPKRYTYKVFSAAGQYLGDLPKVISEFKLPQDINTAGSQISIECAVSADTSRLPANVLTDEADNVLTDEADVPLTDEGVAPIIAPGGSGSQVLVKNGNTVQVWEYSYFYPNGKCLFLGQMERWEATFGDDETIKILCYSDAQDLDNFLVRGNPYTYTTDVSQTSQNTSVGISVMGGKGAGWYLVGQTWKAGVGVTNLGAVSLLLLGTAHVTIDIFDTPALSTFYGSVTQFVSVGSPTEVQLGLPVSVVTVPGNTYFFRVSVDGGESITVYYSNANPYANGQAYSSSYGGGGGGAFYPGIGADANSDLYFKTASGTGSTTGTFTSLDPSTGMLEAAMNDYIARGGLVTYDATTITATGLSLTYQTNTNTVKEFIDAILSLSPNGFYYYVDQGTDTLYFKLASTTADYIIRKGVHIEKLTLTATIENIKNSVYFVGGDIGGGVNLYKLYQDSTSIANYGTRLDRKTDNRVTVTATANAIGQSEVAELKDEDYQTTVTVLYRTMDTTLLKPGLIIGFEGFGTFVDGVLAQIVRVDYTPEEVTLTLGILPVRLNSAFEVVLRGLIAQQTIANPSAPS